MAGKKGEGADKITAHTTPGPGAYNMVE